MGYRAHRVTPSDLRKENSENDWLDGIVDSSQCRGTESAAAQRLRQKNRQSSVLHLLETISEEEEGGALVLLLLLVGEAEGALVVHILAHKELHLAELARDELDELGRAALKQWNTFGVTLLESGGNLREIGSGPGHKLCLGEALNFVESELVLNVNYSLSFLSFLLLISGDVDYLSALGDILGLGLDAGIFHGELVGERVRKEFVTGDMILEYFHVVFSFLSCFL